MLNDSLEAILNYKKIKYVKLDELIKPYIYDNDKIDTVNIFIDLYSVIREFYSPSIVDNINISKESIPTIVSQIINIAAHYRNYIWTRLNCYSNIYFLYTNKEDTYYKSITKDYKYDFYNKFSNTNNTFKILNKVIDKSINLISLICEYLPNIYFLNSENIDSNIIMKYLISDKPNEFNLILSRDKVQYQLVLKPNTIATNIKGDDSIVIDSINLLQNLLSKKKQTDFNISIIPNFYTFILSIAGYPKYTLFGVKKMGVIKSIKLIEKKIELGQLSNIEYDIESFIEGIKDKKSTFTDDDLKTIEKIYKCINLDDRKLSRKEKINFIDNKLINKKDSKGLRYINDSILGSDHYIMLEELMKGEDY